MKRRDGGRDFFHPWCVIVLVSRNLEVNPLSSTFDISDLSSNEDNLGEDIIRSP